MGKQTERIKTTVGLSPSLWRRTRIRAVEERRDLQDVVADALELYLKTPTAKGKEGGR